MGRALGFALVALALIGCTDSKPAHYYVWCEEKDASGWLLIDWEEDPQGYLLACTYQSPDKRQMYTARCTDQGCD